jgi:hypothetical protein
MSVSVFIGGYMQFINIVQFSVDLTLLLLIVCSI